MKGNFNALINGKKPVLVDFYADWCAPCKLQTPILQEVSTEMNDKIRIIKIDVDRNQSIASRFRIRGVPTLMLFNKGQAVWSQSGVARKQELIDIITRNL